jgi:hypothetical protein
MITGYLKTEMTIDAATAANMQTSWINAQRTQELRIPVLGQGVSFVPLPREEATYPAIIRCAHCGGFAAVQTACVHCGAPVL